MKKRTTWGVLAAVCGVVIWLSGCGTSKQEALAVLQEARFAVSSAKSIDTQVYAKDTLKAAQTALEQAEKDFKTMRYGRAKEDAGNAIRLAKQARVDAQKKTVKKGQERRKTATKQSKSKKRK